MARPASKMSHIQPVQPKPGPNEKEIGFSLAATQGWWMDFPLGGSKERNVAVSNALVTIDQLVEMRRKDGQIRALLRLFQLPIIGALKTASWISPDAPNVPNTVKSVELAAAPTPPGAVQQAVAVPTTQPPMPEKPPTPPEVEFANLMFTLPPEHGGMSTSIHKILRHTLLALAEGYATFEEVRYIPDVGPLKGKVTLRKLAHRDARTIRFLVDDNGGFDGVRQIAVVNGEAKDVVIPKEKVWYWACLAGETEVPLLDGSVVTIRELAEKNEQAWVYSYEKGRVVPALMKKAWKTGRRRVVRVVLDNGEVVVCTPDHRWMVRDGSWKQASDLLGHSIMPFSRRQKDLGSSTYEQVWHPNVSAGRRWQWTHSAVSQFFEGVQPNGVVVHHRDFDHQNNSPENLEREDPHVFDKSRRAAFERCRLGWQDPKQRETWERKLRQNRIVLDLSEIRDAVAKAREESRSTDIHLIASELGRAHKTLYRRVHQAGFSGWSEFVESCSLVNHTVVRVEDAGEEDVYDLEVEGTHTFALQAGGFVHNCSEEENPFYGVSMFEAAWFHWDIKRKLYYITHQAAQMSAVAARVGKVPPQASNKDVTQFRESLRDLTFAGAMTMPDSFDVDSINGNTGFDFLKYIEHQNMEMAKSVLARFLNDENRQVLIDNGGGDASADFFVMALETLMGEIAESWTRFLMPKYIDWNFGSGVYPIFQFGPLADATKDLIKELLITIATAQSTQWTPEFNRELEKKMVERIDLEIDYDAIEKREREEFDRMSKQRDLEAKQFESYVNAQGTAAQETTTATKSGGTSDGT